MTVAVVGPGAIGSVVAAGLHAAGREVLVCGRTARATTEVRPDGGEPVVIPSPVLVDPSAVAGPVELVLLAVKATQNAGAADWLAALCGPGTVVCVLQNGVEQVATVGPYAGGATVLPSVVWFPAETTPDGWVRLRGPARLTVPAGEPGERVAAVLAGTTCEVEITTDFAEATWRKLLQNAAAGLMALTGRRAGVFRRQDVAALAERYLGECLAVARAEGVPLPDGVPAETVGRFREFPPDLTSSILGDREAGRPLEWDVRNGVISRLGARHGIPTPLSDLLVPLLAATSDGPG